MLLIAFTSILLRSFPSGDEQYLGDVAGQMFSFYLLPAMGFALALRRGAIDLSVWAVSALGGAAAATVIRAGGGPATGLLAAAITGGLVGAANGLLVAVGRLPSAIATFFSAATIVLALQAVFQTGSIAVSEDSLNGLFDFMGRPPLLVRIRLVALAHIATLAIVGLIALGRHMGRIAARPRLALSASLCGSGVLAAVGGAIWLVDHASTPLPVRFIGDLRIPAAAILAGAGLLCGGRRDLLVLLCLPAAVVATTIWRLEAASLPLGSYHLQTPVLAGMTIVTHLGIINLSAARKPYVGLSAWSPAMTAGGMFALAFAAGSDSRQTQDSLHAAGIAAWAIGTSLLIVCRLLANRPRASPAPT
jgi:ribose/xylose/arabinose/galactoside ABC-type transport system permease subunit